MDANLPPRGTAVIPASLMGHDGTPTDPANLAALFGQVDELRTTLKIEGQPEEGVTVLAFRGHDAPSGVATYDLTLGSSAQTAALLDDALGREAVFTVARADDEASLHVMRGIVEEIFPSGVAVGKNQRQTLLRIAPHLAELGHGQGSKVYQNLTVVDIAKDLLKPWQIALDPRLHPAPLKRDYCTQVNESGLSFLSRILAEEGIHFHIEHGKDKSTVVLVNDPRGYSPVTGKEVLAYRDAAGAITVDHISAIRRERRVRPNSVVHRDYNFLKPARQMEAIEIGENSSSPGSLGAREFYEYPGSYNDPDEPTVGVGPDVQGATKKVGFPRGDVVRPLRPTLPFGDLPRSPAWASAIGVGLPMLSSLARIRRWSVPRRDTRPNTSCRPRRRISPDAAGRRFRAAMAIRRLRR